MIKFSDLFSVLNSDEVILVNDTDGSVLWDSKGDPIHTIVQDDYFYSFFESNYDREVNDITVVKQDLSLDETTLLIQLV